MIPAPLRSLLSRDEGQTMAEYAIVLAVITLALLTAFGVLSSGIEASIERARAIL